MTMIPPEKLAWMAAVLDLRGAVVRKQNPTRATPQLVLMVESKHLGVIGELCRLTGSTVEPRSERRVKDWMKRGCTDHCPEPHIHCEDLAPGYLPAISRWSLTGAAAAVVLFNVIPYMVTDRGMEDLMTEALNNVNLAGRSGNAARQAVARLAKLGWDLPEKIAAQAAMTGLEISA
jgi:hypothetical protein